MANRLRMVDDENFDEALDFYRNTESDSPSTVTVSRKIETGALGKRWIVEGRVDVQGPDRYMRKIKLLQTKEVDTAGIDLLAETDKEIKDYLLACSLAYEDGLRWPGCSEYADPI